MEAIEIVKAALEGNRIKEVLSKRGISQEEAARRVGVSYRQFNRVVLRQSEPSLLLALRMEAVLGEPIGQLFNVRLITRPRLVAVRE
jgi:transcriptional regulator with XRE-family HTH domain